MSSFNYWLLVDTVRIPDAYTIINKEILIKESVPLFQGCNFEYLLDQSPLLINLGQDKSILDKWKSLPYFDSSSVMFAVNETVDTSTLLSHLHKLLIIQVDGKKMLFRYYTNALWNQIENKELMLQDIAILLGPAQAWYWINNEQQIQSIKQENIHYQLGKTDSYALLSACFTQWV
ncbi:UDP-N-acetylmuramyl peptide synthase [Photobacterium iliopiscarium]|jgi:hypothetical protein|uniref:DUF4123 domain-containing protein n=1 Tax=Photobacterium iliopiscarium TaxID=56192 RepID=UPI000D16685C|nr:DUF4123 domain-containing protein [Photobacterium iliopiscarium]PST95996.1 UDP-N-acetylmuramyl peptide synthase [Photobacterium iliopiscarium]